MMLALPGTSRLPAAATSIALAVFFTTSLAPALVQIAAFHHGLCAGAMTLSAIFALHAMIDGAFWPQIMLAGALSVMTVHLWSKGRIELARSALSALLAPVMVGGGCLLAQTIAAAPAGHALLMAAGLLAAVGVALAIPTRLPR